MVRVMAWLSSREASAHDAASGRTPADTTTTARDTAWWSLFFVAVSLFYTATRVAPLDQGLWHDELYTVSRFVSHGPTRILSRPWIPNNHILFNLLEWATTQVLGTSEIGLRLWAVIPATFGLAWVCTTLFQRNERRAAAVFACLATISPVLLELSVQARGYGLVMFAMSAYLVAGLRLLDSTGWRWAAILASGAAIGVLALPVFVLPVAVSFPLFVWRHGRIRGNVIVAMALAAGAVGGVYLPLLPDVLHATAQQFGHRLSILDVPLGPVRDQIAPSTQALMHVRWWESSRSWVLEAITQVVTLGLMLLGTIRLSRTSRLSAIFVIVTIFGTYLGLFAGRFYFSPRFASFTVIPILFMASLGAVELTELRATAEWRARASGVMATLVVLGFLAFGDVSTEFNAVPEESFKRVWGFVRGFRALGPEVYPVYVASTRPIGLKFYLKRRIHLVGDQEGMDHICARQCNFIFVDHRFGARSFDASCLRERGASVYHFRQRRRGSIDVWVWPPREPNAR